ncbi:hypothetical protein FS837_001025 [Tulasnella sp. UAMH 9824]|nr:hypothetical protein FS837_001025 [Tulasnella sp. UAMH 9824]
MKLFTFIVFVLAFWPTLLDCSVSGRTIPLPTACFPTKTRPVGDASYTRTAVLQVLPTPHMVHRNNGAQSSGRADSTILIWTGFQVNPVRDVVGTGHASLDFAHRNFQTAWSRARHWWRVGSVWLVDAVVTFAVYLLFSITVEVALLSMATAERRTTVGQPQRKHTFISSITPVEGSLERDVHELVTHKQLSIHTLTLEGRLVLSFEPCIPDSPAEWTVLFHPRQYYTATSSTTKPCDDNTEPDVVHKYVLNMLFRGVTTYYPWTWHTPGIVVNVPKEVVKEVRTTPKPTLIRSIGGARKSNDHGPKTQRRMIVARAVRRPTFAPSILRIGGSLKPLVRQPVLSKQPRHPALWIEKFTLEGRLLMYAGSTPPGQPVNWVIQFRPYSGYHLTTHGDDSSAHHREFMVGYLFNISVRGGLGYPPSIVYVPETLLELLGGMVRRSNNLTATSDSLDVTIMVTNASPSTPHTPNATTIFEYQVPSMTAVTTVVQLDSSANPEAAVALDLLENWSSAERVHELVPANAKEDDDKSREFLGYTNSRTTDSDEVEPFPPVPETPTSSNPTSLDPTYDDFIREQRAAVLHELRLLLPERAHQRHARQAWQNGSSGLR